LAPEGFPGLNADGLGECRLVGRSGLNPDGWGAFTPGGLNGRPGAGNPEELPALFPDGLFPSWESMDLCIASLSMTVLDRSLWPKAEPLLNIHIPPITHAHLKFFILNIVIFLDDK
jgi:hypothetical protein